MAAISNSYAPRCAVRCCTRSHIISGSATSGSSRSTGTNSSSELALRDVRERVVERVEAASAIDEHFVRFARVHIVHGEPKLIGILIPQQAHVQAVRVALGKLDHATTGATLSAGKQRHPALIELKPALPVLSIAIAARERKDDVKLRNSLQDALDCMKKDGTIAKFYEKWFSKKPGPDDLAVVITPGYGVPGMPGYDPTPHELKCN